MIRRIALALMALSLAVAVFLKGGVVASQWTWTALGVSLASVLATWFGPPRLRASHDAWVRAILTMLLGWMLFQLVPLPPAIVGFLSPLHWSDMQAARAATGRDPQAWLALSVAPAATWERLLDVVPAMALFLAAREVAWWWAGRLWIAVAPVLAIAGAESLLGLAQSSAAHAAELSPHAASGTYVNYDHFAGLLEMAFPLAVMGAVAFWRSGATRGSQSASAALRASGMLTLAASLLMGIVFSTSRMGVISTLAALALTTLGALTPRRPPGRDVTRNRRRRWLWLIPLVLPLLVLGFLSTSRLVLRFADLTATKDLSQETRVQIWTDTVRLAAAYRWTGCGLGAYEHALCGFKSVAPLNTVDFAHNDYLQILSELGLPGLLLAAALGAWIVKRTLDVVLFRRGHANWEWAVGLLGVFLAMGLHSLADFNLYIPANALTLAWLAGVAVSIGSSPIPQTRGGSPFGV